MTSPVEAPPAQLVAGKYQLTRMLGRGGMGSVWEGVHTSLGTRVAVKFIDAEYADSREARSRFENEARAAATLRSKHVVQVFDHGVMDDGRPWIVMEYLAGEPLDRRLDRAGRLTAAETGRIIQQVCRALSKAHEAGIVHRDLKPENVFLVWDEEDGADIVKVVDFGIAKFSNNSLGVSSSTRTGSVLGTPYYMSPEQARGLRSVDFRSDLWSVAVISYRCLIGTLPFDGEAVGDLLVKICTAPLPIPSQSGVPVPPGYDAWFARALQRDPSLRFANAAELADTLGAVCGLAARARFGSATGEPALAVGAATVQANTGGGMRTPPTLQMDSIVTPSPMIQTSAAANRPARGGLILAAVLGVLVLAIGAGVLVKLLGGGSAETATTAEVATTPAAAPPPPAAAPPMPEPTPAPVPAATPEPAPPKPAAVMPPPKKPAASKPAAAAKPASKPAAPKPRPSTTGSRPPSIDVGY